MCNAITRGKSYLILFLLLLLPLVTYGYEGDAILDGVQPEGGGKAILGQVEISEPALDTADSWIGMNLSVAKTAGATDATKTLMGNYSDLTFAQAGGTLAAVRGWYNSTTLQGGTLWLGLHGVYNQVSASGGTLNGGYGFGSIYGFYNTVISSGATVDNNIYGFYSSVNAADDPGGAAYNLYLTSSNNVDYEIYQESDTPSYLKGDLTIENATINTTESLNLLRVLATKTAGVTDSSDVLRGAQISATLDQVGGVVGGLIGLSSNATLTTGTADSVTGVGFTGYLSAVAVVNNDFYGNYKFVYTDTGSTVGGNVYGDYSYINVDGTVTGNTYGYYMLEANGVDYGFYQNGTAPNVFGGSVTVGGTWEGSDSAPFKVKSASSGNAIVIEENSGSEQWQIGVNGSGSLVFTDSLLTTRFVLLDGSFAYAYTGMRVDGGLNIDTDSGSDVINISRTGSADQSLQMYIDDQRAVISSVQDEATGAVAGMLFRIGSQVGQSPYFWLSDYRTGTDSLLLDIDPDDNEARFHTDIYVDNNDLTVDKTSGNATLSLLALDGTSYSNIYFGDTASGTIGELRYNHTNDTILTYAGGSIIQNLAPGSGSYLYGSADDANMAYVLAKPTRDATHPWWYISHRDNNQDLYVYAYDGTTVDYWVQVDYTDMSTAFGGDITVPEDGYIGTPSDADLIQLDGSNNEVIMDGNLIVAGNIGLNGNNALTTMGIRRIDNTFESDESFYGIYLTTTKTAGASNEYDTYRSANFTLEFDQSGGVFGASYGIVNTFILSDGDVGTVGNTKSALGMQNTMSQDGGLITNTAYGMYNQLDLNAGTVTNDAIALYIRLDQESGHTIGGDAFSQYLYSDFDGTVTGNTYVIYSDELSGVDYFIYQNGTAPSVFGGDITVPEDGYIGTPSDADLIQLDGSGNKLIISGTRPLKLIGDSGGIQKTVDVAGWAFGWEAVKLADGTSISQFGHLGTGDTLTYSFVGVEYDDTFQRWYPTYSTIGDNVSVEANGINIGGGATLSAQVPLTIKGVGNTHTYLDIKSGAGYSSGLILHEDSTAQFLIRAEATANVLQFYDYTYGASVFSLADGTGDATFAGTLNNTHTAIATDTTYYGYLANHTRTGGTTDAADDVYGAWINSIFDNNGATMGALRAIYGRSVLTDGTSGDISYGVHAEMQMDGGVMSLSSAALDVMYDGNAGNTVGVIRGANVVMDLETALNADGNAVGVRIYIDDDSNTSSGVDGEAILLELAEGSNVDYALYHTGSAPSTFGGLLYTLASYSNDMNGDTIRDLQINNAGELGYDSGSRMELKTDINYDFNYAVLYDQDVFEFEYKSHTEEGRYSGPGTGVVNYGLDVRELAKVLPGKNSIIYVDEEGEPEGINYKNMVPILLKMIQEQNERIDQLEAINNLPNL